MHGKSGEQKRRRAPRCRSEDDAYPHQALQAYSNLVMTTDLKTACRAVSHKPCARSIVGAYRVCEHLLTILLTWSLFMVALWNRETIYIFMLWFVLSCVTYFQFPIQVCYTAMIGHTQESRSSCFPSCDHELRLETIDIANYGALGHVPLSASNNI